MNRLHATEFSTPVTAPNITGVRDKNRNAVFLSAALVIKGGQGRRQGRKNPRATTLKPSQNQTEPIETERPAALVIKGGQGKQVKNKKRTHASASPHQSLFFIPF